MRLASIDAIAKLLEDEDDVEALAPFVERFRHRMLEAAADVDAAVCAAALGLLRLLLRHDLVSLQQLAPIIRCRAALRCAVLCCAAPSALFSSGRYPLIELFEICWDYFLDVR